MVSNDESFSHTGHEPSNYFLTETYVESLTESTTGQRFPEQRFLEDVDYDDATIGEMLFNAHREQVYHSREKTCLLVSRRPCPRDRGNPLSKEWQKAMTDRGNPLSKEVKRRHEFQANYGRRSVQKLSETIESQREELHWDRAEGLHRRDQQLLHEQLLKQNLELREAHQKSLSEMKE